MAPELEEEERQITYMTAGRGRGPTKHAVTLAAPSSHKERNPPLPWFSGVSGFERGPVTARSRSRMQFLLRAGLRKRARVL